MTVFGAEPRVNYNRIMLSPVLSGEKTFEDIIIHDEDWYDRTRRRAAPRRVRSSRSTARRRRSRRRAAKNSPMTGWSSPPVRCLSSFRFPAPISKASSLSAISTMSRRCTRPPKRRQCRGDRRRPARPRSGGRPGAQGHEGFGRASDADPDGAPARPSAGYLLEKAISARGIDVYTRANTEAILGADRVKASS